MGLGVMILDVAEAEDSSAAGPSARVVISTDLSLLVAIKINSQSSSWNSAYQFLLLDQA
jgi:hypothetical protein